MSSWAHKSFQWDRQSCLFFLSNIFCGFRMRLGLQVSGLTLLYSKLVLGVAIHGFPDSAGLDCLPYAWKPGWIQTDRSNCAPLLGVP